MPFLLAEDAPAEPGFFTQALIDFFMWFLGWLCDLVRPLIEYLIGLMPDDWVTQIDQNLASFAIYGGAINEWVALDWAFSLLAVWVVFMVVFLAVKILLKVMVPGIG